MSAEGAATAADKKPRKRQNKKPSPAAGTQATPKPEKKERPASVPVPDSMINSVVFGRVCDVLHRGREKFGFIYMTPSDNYSPPANGEKTGIALFTHLPRIYFNSREYKETEFKVRKNDLVTFTCKKDEKDRPFASEITLTAAGKEAVAVREAAHAAIVKTAPPKDPKEPKAEGEAKPKRERKEKVIDTRSITLKITCASFPGETKEIVAVMGETIGKLKHNGITAFDAPVHLNVFHKGALLTKTVLLAMAEGETIHLGEPLPKPAA